MFLCNSLPKHVELAALSSCLLAGIPLLLPQLQGHFKSPRSRIVPVMHNFFPSVRCGDLMNSTQCARRLRTFWCWKRQNRRY